MKVGPGVQTIDDYINACPPAVRKRPAELRTTIRAAAPDAIEKISYQMPTFYQRGNLVHFAAFAGHIGLYPTPSAIRAFSNELRGYKTSKGAIRLPLDAALPLGLIAKIVKYRVAENARHPVITDLTADVVTGDVCRVRVNLDDCSEIANSRFSEYCALPVASYLDDHRAASGPKSDRIDIESSRPCVSHNQRCPARCITTRARCPRHPCWRLLAGFDRPARSAMPS
jgi:uncharacterized protein YdhG (YjbR/CyaY superfamily)